MTKAIPPFVPPGSGEGADAFELRNALERALEGAKRTETALRKDYELQLRRLRRELVLKARILANCGARMHELELELAEVRAERDRLRRALAGPKKARPREAAKTRAS